MRYLDGPLGYVTNLEKKVLKVTKCVTGYMYKHSQV